MKYGDRIMGKIKAICISKEKGTAKVPITGKAEFVKDFGIKHDAHAGKWHRQVSLLAYEKIEAFKAKGAKVRDGSFGENIITEGIDLKNLPVGTVLIMGTVILRVTQIGKECHSKCAIAEAVGSCIMPTEGIFAEVIQGGKAGAGDSIIIR